MNKVINVEEIARGLAIRDHMPWDYLEEYTKEDYKRQVKQVLEVLVDFEVLKLKCQK